MNFFEFNFEIVFNYFVLVFKFNRVFMRFCLCVFLFVVLLVFLRSSEISLEIFFVFKMFFVMFVFGRIGICVVFGGWVDIFSIFFVVFCLLFFC